LLRFLREALFERVKPKSAGVLQRLDAISAARQAASRFQCLLGSVPVSSLSHVFMIAAHLRGVACERFGLSLLSGT
jgi:hypothetical protein